MTHHTRLLQAFMALALIGFIVFGIREDVWLAATFLFGYLCVMAWWVWGRGGRR